MSTPHPAKAEADGIEGKRCDVSYMRIYELTSPALGDAWGSLNRCLEIALSEGNTVGISVWWHDADGSSFDCTEKLSEMMPLLHLGGMVRLTTGYPSEPRFDFAEALTGHRFPTRCVWRPGCSRTVCYQFDSRSQAHLATPSADDMQRFLQRMEDAGLDGEDLGHGRPLAECVRLLAACHAYVGLSSGMSQVAISTGAPLHVVRNRIALDDFYGVFDRRQGRAHRTLDEVDTSRLEEVGVIRWDDRLRPDA